VGDSHAKENRSPLPNFSAALRAGKLVALLHCILVSSERASPYRMETSCARPEPLPVAFAAVAS
jgi:hypothetical protein